MSGNPAAGLGKKTAGAIREFVAELTGDASLQERGREEIAEGRRREAGIEPELPPARDPQGGRR